MRATADEPGRSSKLSLGVLVFGSAGWLCCGFLLGSSTRVVQATTGEDAPIPKVIRAESFQVVDQDGVIRGVYGFSDDKGDGTVLSLTDRNKTTKKGEEGPQIVLRASRTEDTFLTIGDVKKGLSAMIGVHPDGRAQLGLTAGDEKKRRGAVIAVHPDGRVLLGLAAGDKKWQQKLP